MKNSPPYKRADEKPFVDYPWIILELSIHNPIYNQSSNGRSELSLATRAVNRRPSGKTFTF